MRDVASTRLRVRRRCANPVTRAAVAGEATCEAPNTLAIRGHRVGQIVGVSDDGRWLVTYAGNPHGDLHARTTLELASAALENAARAKTEALLVFEHERSDLPIVVGLLSAPVVRAQSPTRVTEVPAPDAASRLEAVVDGRRVTVEAEDEIVLRCGDASITLRRNGRVVVRGTYVETRSKGVNRIKGGSVQIN